MSEQTGHTDTHYRFAWNALGDIEQGRPRLGSQLPVKVYRTLLYSINAALFRRYGPETADAVLREAGHSSGSEFCRGCIEPGLPASDFLGRLEESLAGLKIGILRIEQADFKTGRVLLSVLEDLDCSGLPSTNELVCCYDEGFFAGVFEAYTGAAWQFREIECWASGGRVCRFEGIRA